MLSMLRLSLPIGILLLGFSSCSTEADDTGGGQLSSVPAYVEGIDLSSGSTTRAIGQDLKTFSMYSMTMINRITGAMLSNGIYYKKEGTSWASNLPYYMDERMAMKAFGISPKVDFVKEPVYKWLEQHFIYENPQEEQVMLKIASKLNYTKAESKNQLLLNFNDALYTLRFQALNSLTIENCHVYIKGVTIHNLPNKAMFTYDDTKESTGTWTLTDDNEYVDYSQELESPVELSKTLQDINDSAFVLLPFVPDLWVPTKETMEQADDAHHLYIEVKAQITQDIDNGDGTTRTVYLWGSRDGSGKYPQYESIFYQYMHLLNTTQKNWKMAYNGYYRLTVNKNGYDKNGVLFTPHPDDEDGATAFTSSDPIDFTVVEDAEGNNVDPWSGDTDNSSVSIIIK